MVETGSEKGLERGLEASLGAISGALSRAFSNEDSVGGVLTGAAGVVLTGTVGEEDWCSEGEV